MFNFKWNLGDGYPAKGINEHKSTVFSTFSCGGGSSMGYKLAGYDVIGANDIDPQMEKVYKANHNPKIYLLSDIRGLIEKELPKELYNLDVLDGSPPCSTFSMAGSREKAWGKEKVFREGQRKQVLDDLFFEFITLAKKLQPKVVIAENVKGMLMGNAKGYIIEIKKKFIEAGYDCQIFLLNASTMGVPQRRERVFFLCKRKDLNLPDIKIEFNEKPITISQAIKDLPDLSTDGKRLTERAESIWKRVRIGDCANKVMNGSWFNYTKLNPNSVAPTVTATGNNLWHWTKPHSISKKYITRIGSFPDDYNYLDVDSGYLVGMSVPPVMMAQVANQVYLQWLSKL